MDLFLIMRILYMKTTYKKSRSVIILMLFTTQIRAIRYFLRGDLIVFEFNLNQSILHIDLLQRFTRDDQLLNHQAMGSGCHKTKNQVAHNFSRAASSICLSSIFLHHQLWLTFLSEIIFSNYG